MTRMLKTIMLTGTALAMLAVAPARSVEAVNSISPNRLTANGITPNGANGFTGSGRAVNSAGEIGRVIAVELPRQSGVGISVLPALP